MQAVVFWADTSETTAQIDTKFDKLHVNSTSPLFSKFSTTGLVRIILIFVNMGE